MPNYTNLPSAWQTAIEKKFGSFFEWQFVVDPENRNEVLRGKNGIESVSTMNNGITLDFDYERRPVLQNISVVLRDPDGDLNTTNSDSIFYRGTSYLYESITNISSAIIKIEKITGITFSAGNKITVAGITSAWSGIVQKYAIINTIVDSGSYYTVTLDRDILNYFKKGAVFYRNSFNEECLVQLKITGSSSPVIVFKGKMLKEPKSSKGYLEINLVDYKKDQLETTLIGADADSTKKLMQIDNTGSLENSVSFSGSGTLDRTDVYPLRNCRIGTWTAAFTSATDFVLSGPGIKGESANINYGHIAALSGTQYSGGTFIAKNGNYAFFVSGNGYLKVINITDKTAPTEAASLALYASTVLYSSIAHDGANHVYVAINTLSGGAQIYSVDVTTPGSPSIDQTITAGDASGLPSDFSPYGNCLVSGNYLYICDNYFLTVIDITTPTAMTYSNRSNGNGDAEAGLWCIKKSGNYIYSSWITSGKALIIFDVSTPTAISVAYDSGDIGAYGELVIAGSYLYIKTGASGEELKIYDITTPGSPSLDQTWGSAYSPYYMSGFTISDLQSDLIIACDGAGSITIIDASTPGAPVVAESVQMGDTNPFNLAITFHSITWDGEYLYYTDWSNNFHILRLSTSYSNFPGQDQIVIDYQAWGGTINSGDTASFLTGVTFQDENPVDCIETILRDYTNIRSNIIDVSSVNADKFIGTLYDDLENGDTTVKIAVSVPTIIETSEIIKITSAGADLTITGGNAVTASYPPYIELTISSYPGTTKTAGSEVYWKDRASLNTDFSFDDVADYCNTNDLNISITFNTETYIANVIETLCSHFDGFSYTDNWGVIKLFAFREQSGSGISVTSTTNLLSNPDPENESVWPVNDIRVKYSYYFSNGQYGKEYVYQGIDGKNSNQWKTNKVKTGILYLPGFFAFDKADFIAENKFRFWVNGIQLVQFYTTIEGIIYDIGDIITLTSDYPLYTTEKLIIIDRSVSKRGAFEFKFTAYVYGDIW